MRALLDVRASGIPVVVLIGGANGCFGGMGIVARCADQVVMSDIGRLAMSGPEVIEASHGVDEDRKSTRLNSSHSQISYAVFCLKKKKKIVTIDLSIQLSRMRGD